MKKRKGETLAEAVVALAAFGILLSGVTDFMANQLQYVARTKKRDDVMYSEQWLTARAQWLFDNDITTLLKDHSVTAGGSYPNVNFTVKGESKEVEYVEANIVSFDWDCSEKKLIVKNDITSVDFSVSP